MTDKVSSSLVAGIACYFIGALQLWLQPSVVADLVQRLHLSEADAGLLATFEMVLVSGTMLLFPYAPFTTRLRTIAIGGLMLVIAGNLASIPRFGLWSIVTARSIAAVGFGLMLLVANAIIGQMREPQRRFGQMYFVSLIASSLTLFTIPTIAAHIGYSPAYMIIPALSAIFLFFHKTIDSSLVMARSRNAAKPAEAGTDFRIVTIALSLSFLAFGFFGVWAFLVTYAEKSGVDPAGAALAGGLSIIAAIISSAVSARVTEIVGFRLSATIAALVVAASVFLLINGTSPAVFYVSCCTVIGGFYFLFPIILGSAATIDRTGVGSARVSAVALLVGALGPYLSSLATKSLGIAGLQTIIAVLSVIAILLLQLVAHWVSLPHDA